MNRLSELKLILNIEDTSKDNLLNLLIEQSEKMLLSYIKEIEVPNELNFIITDISLMKYNRLGNEGIKSSNVLGVSQSFTTDYLEPYYNFLASYLKVKDTPRKVKFY